MSANQTSRIEVPPAESHFFLHNPEYLSAPDRLILAVAPNLRNEYPVGDVHLWSAWTGKPGVMEFARKKNANAMRYDFLIETYETERIKVISVWSMFADEDLPIRPHPNDTRGRSVHEHMVHQCVSEDLWFRTILDVDVGAPPLPKDESRLGFMRRYAHDSEKRLAALREKGETWWEGQTTFFDVARSRAWVLTRRIAHTAHHRGQQLALLRMLGREAHSNYGPTADTGGLMQNHAPTIYAYPSLEALLEGEASGGRKTKLPGSGAKPVTERPDEQR